MDGSMRRIHNSILTCRDDESLVMSLVLTLVLVLRGNQFWCLGVPCVSARCWGRSVLPRYGRISEHLCIWFLEAMLMV